MSDTVWVVEDNTESEFKRIGVFSSAEAAEDATTRYIQKMANDLLSDKWPDEARVLAAWEKAKSGSLKKKLDFYNITWFTGAGALRVERTQIKD